MSVVYYRASYAVCGTPRLNQVVVSCSDGSVKVFYDPDKSHR